MRKKKSLENLIPVRRHGHNVSHSSFWMHPETVSFIRMAAEQTRMPQGTILEIIITYYRLMRRKELKEQDGKHLTLDEQSALDGVYYFLRVLPC